MMIDRSDGSGDNVERDVFLTRLAMELKNTVGDRAFKWTSKQVHKCEQVRVIGKVLCLRSCFGGCFRGGQRNDDRKESKGRKMRRSAEGALIYNM
jgi:hypothetical protein